MYFFVSGFIYILFFLSGAAALIYQVVWVRSLSLVFGGSHLAVTAVLSIFMAGLSIGGYVIGRYVDTVKRPLYLYGLLELGIALFAWIFMGLMHIYPAIYIPLAQGCDDSLLYLSFIRILFSIIALIVPAILMGGTLPVLSRFIARRQKNLRYHLSFLYGCNTLGAVAGATLAGFFLLRLYSVTTTLIIAMVMNIVIGLISILLQDRAARLFALETPDAVFPETGPSCKGGLEGNSEYLLPYKLVAWGIGLSGFCALGYEVLWSRMLTIVIGASVYGFTIMLVAFLTGIALGSEAYGLFPKIFKITDKGVGNAISWFGIVQVIIGLTALIVTINIPDLPVNITGLQNYFLKNGSGFFNAKLWANFMLTFAYMVVPAFFMGLAFPLAGRVYVEYKALVGSAVGEVLAYNTIGAILGAAVSGFVMIYLFGIERSLQMLIIINVGFGLFVFFSVKRVKQMTILVSAVTVALLVFFALNHQALRIWDTKYFAVYQNNQPKTFSSPEVIREAVANADILYYAEGIEAIVSSIRIKGGGQSFITNGRVEASTLLKDRQCQFTLGHLPMLLNKDPKQVFVVGTGSGMTLGATSIHPGVEQITLAEIEPKVIGVARTFAEYNHRVLDNPKLKIVFNDGRNFLMTTKEKFDVITADPIHPWFRGAGYLYSTEYFKLVSEHLRPGGIVCQWLPIYELTPDNVKSVVKTFQENFPYTMLWLTHMDAEIVGSNSPITIDEADLARRIAEPAIADDLKQVMMGSADEFLSYFVLGTEGMKKFAQGAVINTDDNLYLEFSAPYSIGQFAVMGENITAIQQNRESILAYLVPVKDESARMEQVNKWALNKSVAEIAGAAHELFLRGKFESSEFNKHMATLETTYSWFAPGRFLKNEYLAQAALKPSLIEKTAFIFQNERNEKVRIEICAVLVPISSELASIAFVDNNAKVIYGEVQVADYQNKTSSRNWVQNVMTSIKTAYQQEAESALRQAQGLPSFEATTRKMKEIITDKVKNYHEPYKK
ncbi:MAG: spermidine synthase [Desulfobacterium sp.]|nr:spermidine synthase [Desulfobacterium sp.]